MTKMSETQKKRCWADVYDRYAKEGRPCMRSVCPDHKFYCWQHARIAWLVNGLSK